MLAGIAQTDADVGAEVGCDATTICSGHNEGVDGGI
jgi:hypothetical protein